MNVSLPNKEQVVHGIERAVLAFLIAATTVLGATKDATSKAAWVAAGTAGVVAIYQLIVSTLTNR